MFKFQYQNEKNWKSGKNFSGLQNRTIRGLQIKAAYRDYNLGQKGLQIVAALGISNRGKKIRNQDRDFKSRQRDLRLEQEEFQIGARIKNQCRARYKCTARKQWCKVQDTGIKLLTLVTFKTKSQSVFARCL